MCFAMVAAGRRADASDALCDDRVQGAVKHLLGAGAVTSTADKVRVSSKQPAACHCVRRQTSCTRPATSSVLALPNQWEITWKSPGSLIKATTVSGDSPNFFLRACSIIGCAHEMSVHALDRSVCPADVWGPRCATPIAPVWRSELRTHMQRGNCPPCCKSRAGVQPSGRAAAEQSRTSQ